MHPPVLGVAEVGCEAGVEERLATDGTTLGAGLVVFAHHRPRQVKIAVGELWLAVEGRLHSLDRNRRNPRFPSDTSPQ
jgi:hypothetical protein